MKDIKSYVIGFLSCACLFLIMGFTTSGSYQIVSNTHNDSETLWMINQDSGKLYFFTPQKHTTNWLVTNNGVVDAIDLDKKKN